MDVSIEHCKSARVYRPSSSRRIILSSLLVLLYAIVLPYCYNTAGDPRQAAIISAQKLADEKWEQWGNDDAIDSSNSTSINDIVNDDINSNTTSINDNSIVASKLTVVDEFDYDNNDIYSDLDSTIYGDKKTARTGNTSTTTITTTTTTTTTIIITATATTTTTTTTTTNTTPPTTRQLHNEHVRS